MSANDTVFVRDKDGSICQGAGQLYTALNDWQSIGAFSAASTALGPTARDVASVAASTSIQLIDVPTNYNGFKFRFTGVTDGDVNVYDILFANSNFESDHFSRIVTATATVGTQTSTVAAQEFADGIVVSNERWGVTWTVVGALDDTYIGELWVDGSGTSRIAVQCTTLGSAGTVEIIGY